MAHQRSRSFLGQLKGYVEENVVTPDVEDGPPLSPADSQSSEPEFDDSTPSSSNYGGSTTALILVPENVDPLSDLDEAEDEPIPSAGPLTGSHSFASSIPTTASALSFLRLQLFMVAPSLLLGVTLLPDALDAARVGFRSKGFAILWFIAGALLSAFANQIWVQMGRYVRKFSLEDVVAHALVGKKGRREGKRELWRKRMIKLVKTSTASFAAIGCMCYFRVAVDLAVIHYQLEAFWWRLLISIPSAIVLSYFLLKRSLNANRLFIAAAITVLTHVAALCASAFKTPAPDGSAAMFRRAVIPKEKIGSVNWEGLGLVAFAFASPWTVYPLYVAPLVPPSQVSTAPKAKRVPFPIQSTVAAATSLLLLLLRLHLAPISIKFLEDPSSNPIFQSIALLSGIPPLWTIVVVPRLPKHLGGYDWARRLAPSYLLWAVIVVLAIVLPSVVVRALQNLYILTILCTGFVVPALLHIALHTLRSPLSIVVDVADDPEDQHSAVDIGGDGGGGFNNMADSINSLTDALLRRKERSLQRRRLGRRLGWDIGVWLVLLPCGLVLTVWGFGHLFGQW